MVSRVASLLLGLLAVVGVSTSSFANSWCHLPLRAQDGTELRVDYQVGTFSDRFSMIAFEAQNIYLHALNLNADDEVRFVLVVPRYWGTEGLQYDGNFEESTGWITAKSQEQVLLRYAHRSEPVRTFELAVVVNGTWLKDPISGRSNFLIDLGRYNDYCANPY